MEDGQGAPQMALLSAAAGDWWGMPSAETLEAVEGYPLDPLSQIVINS